MKKSSELRVGMIGVGGIAAAELELRKPNLTSFENMFRFDDLC